MTEHTFKLPQESTRFDNGDELRFRVAGENLSELEAARALVARTEAIRRERQAGKERTPQREMLAIGHAIQTVRQERLAA